MVVTNLVSSIVFLIATYAIDLDGLFYLVRTSNKSVYSNNIKQALQNKDLKQAMVLATTNHKKFDALFLHNIIGITLFVSLTVYSYQRFELLFFVGFAVLTHFSFDLFDDYWQLGHLKNWFRFRDLSNLDHKNKR